MVFILIIQELIKVTNSDEVIILSVENMMIFSATVSATDSVAALTMIKPNKYPKLFSVIFGEGMINDAVSIILFICVGLIF
jgi:sodium/hydrogen exchanger-like protein 6/7/sodium/hydrogen exchanger 8